MGYGYVSNAFRGINHPAPFVEKLIYRKSYYMVYVPYDAGPVQIGLHSSVKALITVEL